MPPNNAPASHMDVRGTGEFVLYDDHLAVIKARDREWAARMILLENQLKLGADRVREGDQ